MEQDGLIYGYPSATTDEVIISNFNKKRTPLECPLIDPYGLL